MGQGGPEARGMFMEISAPVLKTTGNPKAGSSSVHILLRATQRGDAVFYYDEILYTYL